MNLDQVKSQDYSRAPASKLWIASLHNQQVQKPQEEFSPAFIQLAQGKISRVNLIAVVTQVYKNESGSYAALTIDDRSAQIRIKAWNEDTKKLQNLSPGDCILVIGKIREYNNELYITPEIIRKQHPDWLLIRQHELLQTQGKPPQVEEEISELDLAESPTRVFEEKIQPSEPKRQLVLKAIAELDQDIGASLTEVIRVAGLPESETNALIKELLQEGEIFKLTADRIKIT